MNERQAVGTAFALLLAVLSASPVIAEVMDKEPTIGDMWEGAIVLGVAGAAAWVWNKWAGMAVSLVVLFFAWGTYLELSDPFVGRDIVLEAGSTYVPHAWAAMVASIAPHIGALIFRLRKRSPGSQVRASA